MAETTPGVSFMQLRALIAHIVTGGTTSMGYMIVNRVELAAAAELVGERMASMCQMAVPVKNVVAMA